MGKTYKKVKLFKKKPSPANLHASHLPILPWDDRSRIFLGGKQDEKSLFPNLKCHVRQLNTEYTDFANW